jgi:hypothetical protein
MGDRKHLGINFYDVVLGVGGSGRAAKSKGLYEYESAAREMVVEAVCSERLSVSIPCLSGNILPFLTILPMILTNGACLI